MNLHSASTTWLYLTLNYQTSLLGFGDIKEKIQQGDSGSSSRYYDLDKWFDKVIDEIQ